MGDNVRYVVLAAAAVLVLAVLFTCNRAGAQEALPRCQTASPCKIMILSKEEEEALTGLNQILDTALQGRPLDLMGKVNYFRDKIRNAPAGASLAPPQPPPTPQ